MALNFWDSMFDINGDGTIDYEDELLEFMMFQKMMAEEGRNRADTVNTLDGLFQYGIIIDDER